MGTDNNETGYSFNLLHEEVASSDLFPDETHENAAKTILKLINTSDRGITVGIEGSWGSGKSTVVELLKQKILDDDKNTLFFLFDAWAHEGDPLRRIFLESLIQEIDPDGTDKVLQKLLNEISSRTKTVKVKTDKKASKLGKRLFLSTLVLPIGAAILSAVNYSGFLWPWDPGESTINKAFVLGLLLSIAPFITLLHWRFFGEKDENNNIKWDFMESDSVENYVQDITEEGERTSIEFEQYFEKILKNVLGKEGGKKYHRAIIIIDNLDRVAAEHAASIWSTLQTFFQHRSRNSGNSPDWMRCLWFLVPYDRQGLSRIWDATQIDEKNKNVPGFSKSFLSKSFQVVAEVPTPVMSAWYDYCVKCVHKSLAQWPESDKQDVINTYQRYGSKLEASPTPRQIHNFVNQAGMLGMRWGGIMSAESIALYAILRQDNTENELRNQLLSRDLPGGYEPDSNTESIKMELAGMLFGVEKDKGIELLIGPHIRSAMTNGDGKALEELINKHGEAFWIVWNAIKKEITITGSHSEEYRIAATQAIYNGMFKYRNRINREIASLEEVWKTTEDKWEMARHNYSSVVPLMANLSQDKDGFLSWCHDVISNKLKTLVQNLSDETPGEDELIQFSEFESFLSKNNIPLKCLPYSKIGINEWTLWIKSLKDADVLIRSVLPNKGVITELANSMLTNQNTTSKENIDVLITTLDIFQASTEWTDVAEKIVAWANLPSREVGDNHAYELMLKIYALCNKDISSQIQSCVEGNAFWQRGNSEDIESTTILPLLAACTLTDKIQKNEYVSEDIKSYWSNETFDDGENAHIIEALCKLGKLGVIWSLAKDKENKLAISTIKNNIDNSDLYSAPEAIHALNEYHWLDDTCADVVNKICAHTDIKIALADIRNDPTVYDHGLYLLKKYGDSSAKEFVTNLVESMSEELWENCFNKDSYILNISLNDDVKLNHLYTNAFLSHFTSSIVKDISTDWIWANFEELLKKTLDTDMQPEKLAKTYFSLDSDNLNEKAFSALSVHFTKYINKQDPMHLMNRMCDWIDRDQWERIRWFSNAKFNLQGEPIESLTSRLNSCAKELPEGLDISFVENLAAMFHVEITPDSSQEDDNERIEE